MTRTLFLHAGPPKTGTTTIQMYFRDNAAAFFRQGLYRPVTGTESVSHLHRSLVPALAPHSKPASLRQDLAAELRRVKCPDRVFITAEFFASRLAEPAYVHSLKAFCAELGYRLHVIAYLRPQAPTLNSLFTQYAKNWRPPETVDGFFGEQLSSGQHDYLELFRQLRGDPGISLTLRPFNRATLAAGLTGDICKVIGIDTDREELVPPRNVNIAPGPRTIRAFQDLAGWISREGPACDRARLQALTRPLINAAGALGWNDAKFGGIPDHLQSRIESCFAESNGRIAQEIWSKSWHDIFSPEECRAPAFNIFDPLTAPHGERREYEGFLADSKDTIREMAGLQGAP